MNTNEVTLSAAVDAIARTRHLDRNHEVDRLGLDTRTTMQALRYAQVCEHGARSLAGIVFCIGLLLVVIAARWLGWGWTLVLSAATVGMVAHAVIQWAQYQAVVVALITSKGWGRHE